MLSPELEVNEIIRRVARQTEYLRIRAGFDSQTDMEKKSGIRQQLISKLENPERGYHTNPFLVNAIKIARFFDIDPAVFLFGERVASSEALEIARLWESAPKNVQQSVRVILDTVK